MLKCGRTASLRKGYFDKYAGLRGSIKPLGCMKRTTGSRSKARLKTTIESSSVFTIEPSATERPKTVKLLSIVVQCNLSASNGYEYGLEFDGAYLLIARKFESTVLGKAPVVLKIVLGVASPPIIYVRPGRYSKMHRQWRKMRPFNTFNIPSACHRKRSRLALDP